MAQNGLKQKYDVLIAECDRLIKSGQIAAVAHKLSKLNPSQVPRSDRLELASICRRVDMTSHGLRLLQPLIRNENRTLDPATAIELCEYSSLLSRNGSIAEAMGILNGILSDALPKSYLYMAHCHISNWDYELAIPLLQRYRELETDDYLKFVACANLVPAYLITSQWDEAESTLLELIPAVTNAKAQRLLGNCFGFQGRLHFGRGNYAEARASFEKAIEIFGQVSIFDRLFIQKWQSILLAFETKSTNPVTTFREEALRRQDWESVREADLYKLKVDFNQRELDHLTFGTPMSGYRRRILRELDNREPSHTFLYGTEPGILLDLQTGILEQKGDINPGKKIHQLLAALVKDFYAPRKIGALFFDIYPDEYFDPESSPVKLIQIIKRTRRWLKAHNIPAQVILEGGAVRLSIHGAFGIRLSLDANKLDSVSIHLQELRSHFAPGTLFSAVDACQIFNWSKSSFHRIAEYGFNNGLLEKTGSGKNTRYLHLSQKSSQTKKIA